MVIYPSTHGVYEETIREVREDSSAVRFTLGWRE